MHLFCQISNILGLFPVIFLYQNEMYRTAICLVLSLILSLIYHMDETNRTALLFDFSGCCMLSSCMLYLMKTSTYRFTNLNIFCVMMMSAAIYSFIAAGDDTQSEKYEIYHTAWHIFSLYAIGAFVYSYVHSERPSYIYISMKQFLSRFPSKYRNVLGRLIRTNTSL